MKKHLFFIPLTLFAILPACNKSEENNNDGKKELTIQASIATSKATAATEGITWNSGDAILVSCDGEAYNFSTTQSGAKAEFTSTDGLTQEMVGINPLSAYYGCTQYGAFTIPQNQTISGTDSQTRLPMYAYTADAPEKGAIAMTFIPAASILEVAITPAEIVLNKVELVPVDETAMSGNVAGPGTVNPVTGKVSQTGNLKSVSANFQNGDSIKNGITFRMPIGWFSVTGGMKLVLTYNDTDTYEELLWADEAFQSYSGSADSKGYKYIQASVELVLGARDYYVAPNGTATSKGIKENDPTTLDYALSSADEGSVIHLAEGTYNPGRALMGDETGEAGHKTVEISSGLTLIGAGPDKTVIDADGSAYHTVCVTAPSEAKVVLKNLTIKGGNNTSAPEDGKVVSAVNEAEYFDGYGCGLYAIGADLELENVKIAANTGKSGVGAYLNNCIASLKNVEVSGNTSTGNGCGLWASASEITMDGCSVSGNNGGGVAAGLYIYAAKEATAKAVVKDCLFTGNVTTNNNSALYVRGADDSANVTASFANCIIKENQGNMGGGFGTTYATVTFKDCQILQNKGTGNGCNLVYPGSKVTMDNCICRENTAGLAAVIYAYTNAASVELTVLNSEFSGNYNNNRGGAIYARAAAAAGVKLNVANSTFFDNRCGSTGSAIALYGSASYPVEANIYSSTITGNTCTRTSTPGGAVGAETAGVTANIYNSVISGNIWEAVPASADIYSHASSKITPYKSIVGTAVYDASGAVVAGSPAFDPATMLSKKTQEGKTTVFSLVGTDNPAKTYGYDAAGLKGLGSSIDGTVLEKDQWGNTRSGSIMGAYVE